MSNRFHDLTFQRQPDGSIRLLQSEVGEDYIIDLHPEQLLFIAHQLCGMKPETAHKVAELERRIAVLTDKLQNLVCNKAFRGDLIEYIGEGFEYLTKFDGLLDLAMEFDGGRLEPEYKEAPADGEKPTHPRSTIGQAKQTPHPSQQGTGKAPTPPVTDAADSDGQMGLPV